MENDTLPEDELGRMLRESGAFGDAESPHVAPPAPGAGVMSERRHLAPRRPGRRVWPWVAPVSTVALAAIIVTAAFSAAWLGQPDRRAAPTGGSSNAGPGDGAVQNVPHDGVVGTGSLRGPDGTTVGRVEVEMSGGATRIAIRDYRAGLGQLQVNASLVPGGDDGCGTASNWEFVAAEEQDAYVFAVAPETFHGDPTAIDQLAIVSLDNPPDAGCSSRFVARARITWTIPPVRSSLATLADAGAGKGASGEVVTTSSGQRVYVVAPDDRLDDVAARFGIRADDLFYLNEARSPNPEDPMLYIGEELNLDLAFR